MKNTTTEKYFEIMQTNFSDNSVHHYNIDILHLFHLELHVISTKPIIKNKLKELLSELKKVKFQTRFILRV